MRIIGFETTARAASVAVWQDDRPVAETYLDIGLTHSETVLPAADALLKTAGLTVSDMDVFAVACGPGSFTGLRIGMAAVKAMAYAAGKPCAPVSTLEALAWNAAATDGPVCAVMDARCGQVYTALFVSDGQSIVRTGEDRAVSAETLRFDIEKSAAETGKKVFLVGDGALLCYNLFGDELCRLAPAEIRLGHAAGVCRAALPLLQAGGLVTAGELRPNYLRLPQAEREKLAREGKTK